MALRHSASAYVGSPFGSPNLLSFANGPGVARTISDETYKPAEPPRAFKDAWASMAMVVLLRHADASRLGFPAVPAAHRSNLTDRDLGLNLSSTQVKDIL